MSPDPLHPSLPSLAHIAQLEELRIARGMSEIADGFEAIDSGVMCRGPAGSWVNCACGVGLAGPPAADTTRRIIAYYEGVGAEPRVELAPYAHEDLIRQLADAGFVVRVYENILFRMLDPRERVVPPSPAPPGLLIEAVDPGDRVRVREAARVVALGFAPPGAEPRPEDLEIWERCADHPRTTLLAAVLDGRIVGGGSLDISGPIAALFGLSVLAEHRRRGIQQALIAERVRRAAAGGARVATIGARPLVPTERNVRRMGFQIAYTKTILVRPGRGLTPVIG